jgi:hypothetical protein
LPEDAHSRHEHDEAPRKWERAAAFLSAACALHCLALPVATTLLPALGASEALHLEGGFDLGLNMLVVVSVAAGAVWGFRRHRDVRVTSAMALGLLAYLLGHALENTSLSVTAGLILAAASFASTRLTQHCDHAH